MNVFEMLDQEARSRRLSFLVIGGHAVNAYGYARLTADVDLVVRREDRDRWLGLLIERGYGLFHDGGVFLQFSPPPPAGNWPIDLMLVRDETFAKFIAEGREVPLLGTILRIPSLDHLLALKLHALKSQSARRQFKDLNDLLCLVEINHLDLASEKYRQWFLKYGTLELYETALRVSQRS